MPSVHEQLSEQFYKWEVRGRGWEIFEQPVFPEPPFEPFIGHHVSNLDALDDGRRPTFLSSLFRKITERASSPVIAKAEKEPEAHLLIRNSLVELQTSLPSNLNVPKEAFAQFLSNLSLCQEPIAFELLGIQKRVTAQFVAHPADAPLVRRQLEAYFPDAEFQVHEGALEEEWETSTGDEVAVFEFGMEREFMFPLATGKLDPFIGIVGALAELKHGEFGLFQVLFQPVQNEWADSIIRSVTQENGKPFFINVPELTRAAEDKIARPLYAAVVRIAVSASKRERLLQLLRDLAGSLRVFSSPQGNALPTMAEILKGARKYRLGLTLAHQELHQLQCDQNVASAVATHPCTRIVFHVGDDDAKKLAGMFTSFDAQSLKTLETLHAIVRVERSDCDFNLEIRSLEKLDSGQTEKRRNEVIIASRNKYASARSEVESLLRGMLVRSGTKEAAPAQAPIQSQSPPIPAIAEVPRADSAKPKFEVVPQVVEPTPKSLSSRDLGRGGPHHQAIQKSIKAAAESLGFRATIEKQVLNGTGSIDLLLERADRAIACEISISTSVEWEVGNVEKCAKASVGEIAVIAIEEERLRKIEGAILRSLCPDIANRVGYFLPDVFIERLTSFSPPNPLKTSSSDVVERRGYKVKRSVSTASPRDKLARENEAISVITEALSRPKGNG